MLREQDMIFIDGTKHFRNTKSSEGYFRQIKIELRNIELARQQLKHSNYSDERKEEIQAQLDSRRNLRKNIRRKV